jgi:hypothetical protein
MKAKLLIAKFRKSIVEKLRDKGSDFTNGLLRKILERDKR